jgi:hypothetical protein
VVGAAESESEDTATERFTSCDVDGPDFAYSTARIKNWSPKTQNALSTDLSCVGNAVELATLSDFDVNRKSIACEQFRSHEFAECREQVVVDTPYHTQFDHHTGRDFVAGSGTKTDDSTPARYLGVGKQALLFETSLFANDCEVEQNVTLQQLVLFQLQRRRFFQSLRTGKTRGETIVRAE